MSVVSPKRPSGICASSSLRCSSGIDSTIRVFALGEITFEVIPNRPSSFAAGFGEPDHARLRRRVGGLADVAAQAGVGGDVDEAAVAALAHVGDAGAGELEGAAEADVDDHVPVSVGELPEDLVAQQAGVVEDGV